MADVEEVGLSRSLPRTEHRFFANDDAHLNGASSVVPGEGGAGLREVLEIARYRRDLRIRLIWPLTGHEL